MRFSLARGPPRGPSDVAMTSAATRSGSRWAHHRVPPSAAPPRSVAQTYAKRRCVRLVPLGQTAGQRILSAVVAALPAHIEHALGVSDDALGGFAPALALASAWHETQYTRLFRS